MSNNTATVEKIALQLTVEEQEYITTLIDFGALLVTSDKTVYDNFYKYITEIHVAHTDYALHERLYDLTPEMIEVDGEMVKNPLVIKIGSLLVSGKRSIYDITLYCSINPSGDQEFLFPLPIDLVRGASVEQVKHLVDSSVELTEVTEVPVEDFNKLNPHVASVTDLKFIENPNMMEAVIDILLDISDIGDHLDC